jgi:hypothetical protein
MPAKDLHHQAVVQALEADGWRITHDPYRITVGRRNLFIDLGAEEVVAAERQGTKIAVEVKGFEGQSEVHDLEQALGQYLLYAPFLRAQEADRRLYLAVPADVYHNVFEVPVGQTVLAEYGVRLLVFDPHRKEIVQWTPRP